MSWNPHNKYSAKKTYSELIDRKFDSKAEAKRAEELWMAQKSGAITELQFQVPFQLCLKPNIKIRIDFGYKEHGKQYYEDSKGVMTREARVKLAWLKEKHNIDVFITGS